MKTPQPRLFKNVAFIAFPVTNVKSARTFYAGVLGLTETASWEDQWVEYDIGDTTLAITTADEKRIPGTRGVMVALEVVDWDATLAHLKDKSVSLAEGPYDTPVCRSGVIRDPDGNEIILHARR